MITLPAAAFRLEAIRLANSVTSGSPFMEAKASTKSSPSMLIKVVQVAAFAIPQRVSTSWTGFDGSGSASAALITGLASILADSCQCCTVCSGCPVRTTAGRVWGGSHSCRYRVISPDLIVRCLTGPTANYRTWTNGTDRWRPLCGQTSYEQRMSSTMVFVSTLKDIFLRILM